MWHCNITSTSSNNTIPKVICLRLKFILCMVYSLNNNNMLKTMTVGSVTSPEFSHISASMRSELHWLPARFRPEFKICLFVRNCLIGTAPAYLQELCVAVSSSAGRRNLRSASRGDLVVPRADTTRFGLRGFSVSGPAIWNSLPQEVRQTMNNAELFKRRLKTFYMLKQQ